MLRRHADGWRECGSAHCRGLAHRWIDEGTPYARLSAANCGAQPARTLEELEKADARLRENTQKILDKK
jgi:hypothetical protein